ncbi:MAG TPA: hypothetical protein VGP47_01590, partial [Parachlamydiaceae bacterium]|nr:hypothetical protein [Parachlamydiaceae bacterium]
MNKLLIRYIVFFVVCLSTTFSLNAAQNPTFMSSVATVPFIRCAPQLQKYLQALLKIPEAKVLIEGIQKDGPIQIIAQETVLSRRFGAFWDPDRRIICLDISEQSDGSLVGSLLFELHNAAVNSQFDRLDEMAEKGKITKEHYIESMEYIEYLNSLSASKIAEKGMKMGILP